MGTEPYIRQDPGDLITAEAWNNLQALIREDIVQKATAAAEAITEVAEAANATKLDGHTLGDLTEEIIERVIDEVRSRRGYLKLFKVLRLDEDVIIKHNFGACPLIDIFQLEYFKAVCCEDKDLFPAWVTFYLYHSSEKKIRYPAGEDGVPPKGSFEIEEKPSFRVPFSSLLERCDVPLTEDASLSDVETEFWKKFCADEFDDDQYCHSPWFEKCCREEKSVRELKKSGDWNDLWVKMKPCRTVYHPESQWGSDPNTPPARPPGPMGIKICHFDWNTTGLKLVGQPIYPAEMVNGPTGGKAPGRLPADYLNELKVMVLLKC